MQSIWILKPPASSCGRGISLISKAAGSTLPPAKKALVVQKYMKHPLLINDYKFDLRIYAMVTSFDPLKVYLFHNGLVRFVVFVARVIRIFHRADVTRLSWSVCAAVPLQVLHREVLAVIEEPEEPVRPPDELQREQEERPVQQEHERCERRRGQQVESAGPAAMVL
jgi:hypothetical protein